MILIWMLVIWKYNPAILHFSAHFGEFSLNTTTVIDYPV